MLELSSVAVPFTCAKHARALAHLCTSIYLDDVRLLRRRRFSFVPGTHAPRDALKLFSRYEKNKTVDRLVGE